MQGFLLNNLIWPRGELDTLMQKVANGQFIVLTSVEFKFAKDTFYADSLHIAFTQVWRKILSDDCFEMIVYVSTNDKDPIFAVEPMCIILSFKHLL